MSRKKLLFFVTEDWYFCSHRLSLALAAKHSGYDVSVVTRVQSHGDLIKASGLNLIPLVLSRRGINPLSELLLIFRLILIYRKIQPDIVHHVALKPVLYGSVAARVARIPVMINAMAGLGFLFISRSVAMRLVRPVLMWVFHLLLNRRNSRVILQNPDDVNLFCENNVLDESSVVLIRGSGVDINQFSVSPEPKGPPLVVLASRLLWDKGVGEFVEAVRLLKKKGIAARFALIGDIDVDNPSAISEDQMQLWKDEGIVELWGYQKNMQNILPLAHIGCLPSYREGLPKVLLETAACGRPIVATDAVGCREIVRDGVNGFLVPIRDAFSLASALEKLIKSSELRKKMGEEGRDLVVREFSLDRVNSETLALYEDLLAC